MRDSKEVNQTCIRNQQITVRHTQEGLKQCQQLMLMGLTQSKEIAEVKRCNQQTRHAKHETYHIRQET